MMSKKFKASIIILTYLLISCFIIPIYGNPYTEYETDVCGFQTYSEWTQVGSPPIENSLDNETSFVKQGNSSFKFSNSDNADHRQCYRNFNQTFPTVSDWYLQFWLHVDEIAGSGSYTGLEIGIHKVGAEFFHVGIKISGSGFLLGWYGGTVGFSAYERFSYNGSATILNFDTWYAVKADHSLTRGGTDIYYTTDPNATWTKHGGGWTATSATPTRWNIYRQGDQYSHVAYIDYLHVTDEDSFYAPPPPPVPWDWSHDWTWIGMFSASIFMMVYPPSWLAWKIKKSGVTEETIERGGYAMLLFVTGLGLFISCCYWS